MYAENSSVDYQVHTVFWRRVFYPRSLAYLSIKKYQCSQGKDVVRNFSSCIKVTQKKLSDIKAVWLSCHRVRSALSQSVKPQTRLHHTPSFWCWGGDEQEALLLTPLRLQMSTLPLSPLWRGGACFKTACLICLIDKWTVPWHHLNPVS